MSLSVNNTTCAVASACAAVDANAESEMFPFPPLTELVPVTIFYAITFVTGLVGNAIVLFVVCTTHGESLLDNCLVSLTVADLCVIVFCIPILCARWFSYTWMYGMFLCKSVHYIQRMSSAASVFTVTAISLERFKATFDSLQAISGKAQKRVRLLLPSCWVAAILFASPILHVQQLYRIPGPGEYYWCIKSFPLRGADGSAIAYELYFFGILIVGPAAVLAVAYFRISHMLARRSNRMSNDGLITKDPNGNYHGNGNSNGSGVGVGRTSTKRSFEMDAMRVSIGRKSSNASTASKKSKKQSQVAKLNPDGHTNSVLLRTHASVKAEFSAHSSRAQTEKTKHIISLLIATVAVFIFCYAPLQVDSVLQAFGVIPRFNPQPLKTIRMITSLLSSANSSLNPFVYCFVSSKFRNRVKKRLANLFGITGSFACFDISNSPIEAAQSFSLSRSPTYRSRSESKKRNNANTTLDVRLSTNFYVESRDSISMEQEQIENENENENSNDRQL